MMVVDRATGYAIMEVSNETAEVMRPHLIDGVELMPAHEYLPKVNKQIREEAEGEAVQEEASSD